VDDMGMESVSLLSAERFGSEPDSALDSQIKIAEDNDFGLELRVRE